MTQTAEAGMAETTQSIAQARKLYEDALKVLEKGDIETARVRFRAVLQMEANKK